MFSKAFGSKILGKGFCEPLRGGLGFQFVFVGSGKVVFSCPKKRLYATVFFLSSGLLETDSTVIFIINDFVRQVLSIS